MNPALLPLSGLRVIEVCHGIAGAFAGRWLALLGADVLKVEPREGHAMREAEPRFDADDGTTRSVLFEVLNGGKSSLALDLEMSEDVATLRRTCAHADLVLHDDSVPGPLADAAFPAAGDGNGLIVVAVHAFGNGTAYRDWKAADITAYGMGGMMYITGAADREPLKHGLTQAEFAAAEHAVIGALVALIERGRSGVGQHVEATLLDAVAALIFVQTAQYSYTGEVLRRQPRGGGSFAASQVMRTKDGYIAPVMGTGGAWADLVSLLDDERLKDPALGDAAFRRREAARVDLIIAEAMTEQDSHALFREAQRRRLAFGLCQDAAALLACEQHAARDFYETVEVGGRRVLVPGLPFRIAGRRGVALGAAPEVGEIRELGTTPERPPRSVLVDGDRRSGVAAALTGDALAGVRVLEAGMMYAAPMAARMLADYGADVVKVESAKRLDGIRSLGSPPDNEVTQAFYDESSRFNDSNRNKRGIALDITQPEGRDLFLRLAARSDIVIENFTTGVVDRLGIGFEAVRAVNPRVVYISTTGYGQDGPWSGYRAQGQSLEPAFGLAYLTGYADGEPMRCGMTYSDVTAARAGAIAMLAALLLRDRTGEAVYVDLSQYEQGTALVAEALVQYQLTGELPTRMGNRDRRAVPQGAYPSAGDDEWVTISVRDAAEWDALVEVVGDDRLRAPALADVTIRREQHDNIDAVLAEWTALRGKDEAARALQAAGVPAGPVQRADEVLMDPHLRSRGFYWLVDHADPHGRLGVRHYTGPVAVLSRTPGRVRLPAPPFGRHTTDVLESLLELSGSEIAALRERGITSDVPDRAVLRPMVLGDTARQIETGALQRQDADYRERIDACLGTQVGISASS